jgi:hypothetical protein
MLLFFVIALSEKIPFQEIIQKNLREINFRRAFFRVPGGYECLFAAG